MWLLILTSLVLLLTYQLNLHLFFVFLKPKKDNLCSGTEASPWPLGKYKNKQSRRKFQNQQPGFRKPGYFLWLPSYFGIRWGDDIYCSLFHLLNLKCWWCWHAGFTTLCHENILPITLRSQVTIVRGLALLLLSPPNDSWRLCQATASFRHQTEYVPALPGYSWEEQILPGWGLLWLLRVRNLCYQQHINKTPPLSEVRLQARGSPHTPWCSFVCIGHTRRCSCSTRKHAYVHTCLTTQNRSHAAAQSYTWRQCSLEDFRHIHRFLCCEKRKTRKSIAS